jgi:hypothetical protein
MQTLSAIVTRKKDLKLNFSFDVNFPLFLKWESGEEIYFYAVNKRAQLPGSSLYHYEAIKIGLFFGRYSFLQTIMKEAELVTLMSESVRISESLFIETYGQFINRQVELLDAMKASRSTPNFKEITIIDRYILGDKKQNFYLFEYKGERFQFNPELDYIVWCFAKAGLLTTKFN